MIQMVDVLEGPQGATERLLHDPTVLELPPTLGLDQDVAVWIELASADWCYWTTGHVRVYHNIGQSRNRLVGVKGYVTDGYSSTPLHGVRDHLEVPGSAPAADPWGSWVQGSPRGRPLRLPLRPALHQLRAEGEGILTLTADGPRLPPEVERFPGRLHEDVDVVGPEVAPIGDPVGPEPFHVDGGSEGVVGTGGSDDPGVPGGPCPVRGGSRELFNGVRGDYCNAACTSL